MVVKISSIQKDNITNCSTYRWFMITMPFAMNLFQLICEEVESLPPVLETGLTL